ncbi:unnamed protein product [Parajaminaea phylloscopi]
MYRNGRSFRSDYDWIRQPSLRPVLTDRQTEGALGTSTLLMALQGPPSQLAQEQAVNEEEPFAVECVLQGAQHKQHRVSSLAVHGEKLYVGSPSGALSIFRLPPLLSESETSVSSRKTQLISTHPSFHPANKAVTNLRILPALSLILSSCPDGSIHFNSLATLESLPLPDPVKALPSKGITAFETQTYVVDWPSNSGGDLPSGDRTSRNAGQGAITDAGKTLPRNLGVLGPTGRRSTRPRPLSLFQKQDSDAGQPQGDKPRLRLVTTVVIAVRRKLLVIRWLDGQPWDTKEISLAHTARALAFAPLSSSSAVPPTGSNVSTASALAMLFISYGTSSDFAVLQIPSASDSSAAIAEASRTGSDIHGEFTNDESVWPRVRDLHIPEYAGEQNSQYSAAAAGEAGYLRSGLHTSSAGTKGPAASGSGAMASEQPKATAYDSLAAPTTTAGLLGGLGGYIGLTARAKPPMLRAVPGKTASQVDGARAADSDSVSAAEPEVVVVRDNAAIFLSFVTGNPTRRRGLETPSSIEDVALLPSDHIFAAVNGVGPGKHTLQIRATRSLELVQTISFSPLTEGANNAAPQSITALLAPPPTASSSANTSLFAVLTPASSSEAAKIYRLTPRPWRRRLRELIRRRKWPQAVELVRQTFGDGVSVGSEPGADSSSDQDERSNLLPPLLALSSLDRFLGACLASQAKQLHSAQQGFEAAVEQWIELDLNPTKVLSIFPENIAGKGLTKPQSEWHKVWGAELERAGFDLDDVEAPRIAATAPDMSRRGSTASTPALAQEIPAAHQRDRSRLTSFLGRVSRPTSIIDPPSLSSSPKLDGALGATVEQSSGTTQPAQAGSPARDSISDRPSRRLTKQLDSASVRSGATSPATVSLRDATELDSDTIVSRSSLEALGRFLADRRRIFKPILETSPAVSPTSAEDIAMIPSIPLSSLSLPDLTALARVVDTALFKTFLETKPSLVGPLCRIQNWCDVSEVEGLLELKGKHSELINLYGGKGMHDQALKLLRKYSEDEDDEEEKVGPTIRYLQSLGPQHIAVILDNAKWVLAQDQRRGMEIFTADAGKVSSLPRLDVVQLLWSYDRDLCAQYLEHIIHVVGDGDPELHEKLALIYLERVRSHPDKTAFQEQLLGFLSESQQYRPDWLLTQVPSDGLWEVRAVLLGRMGQHRGALGIYVEQIGGEEGERKAEAYCSNIYNGAESEEDRNIFLLLLKLYLRPAKASMAKGVSTTGQAPWTDLGPALRVLSQHASSLDPSAVLDLLPPLVPLSSIRHFLVKGLQISHRRTFNAGILSSIAKERGTQLDEGVSYLQGRRVKITQGRTCPVCGKRLGVSVIAVTHQGEVLHYGCRQQKHALQGQAS